MPRFKVCYLLKRYPRLSQTFIVNEMRALQRLGIAITIVAMKGSDEGIAHEKAQMLDVPVYYLPPLSSIPHDSWKVIASLLQHLGIDHIHAHFATWATTAASFLSDITGIPYSFTAHARDIYHESVDKKALAEKIEKARFVITVSDFNKRYLEGLLHSEGRSGKIIRLYNGIDLDRFKPDNDKKESHLLIGVGRLVQKKGFRYLMDACQILKERGRHFSCIIIGEGEDRTALQAQLAQYSLEKEVSLLGAKPQAEVIQTLRKAELCLLPCLIGDDGDRDGLPTVLLEAMALGVPVISTPIAGIPEMIAHEQTGLLVEEKNPVALAQAIERLLDSPPLRERLSRAALEKVRKDFNLTENAKTLRDYFLTGGCCHAPSC